MKVNIYLGLFLVLISMWRHQLLQRGDIVFDPHILLDLLFVIMIRCSLCFHDSLGEYHSSLDSCLLVFSFVHFRYLSNNRLEFLFAHLVNADVAFTSVNVLESEVIGVLFLIAKREVIRGRTVVFYFAYRHTNVPSKLTICHFQRIRERVTRRMFHPNAAIISSIVVDISWDLIFPFWSRQRIYFTLVVSSEISKELLCFAWQLVRIIIFNLRIALFLSQI